MELDNKKALHYPSIAQAVGLLGIWLLVSIVVILFSALIPDLDQSYVLLIGYAVPLIAVIYIGAKRKRGIQYRSIKKEPPLIAYLILLAATPALGFIIEPLITLIPISDSWKSMLTFMDDTGFAVFILTVIAAPVLEEVLFRGVILDGFIKRYTPAKAILVSSILFGAVHLNPWQFIAGLTAGIAMGWVYWKTKSLFLCIFMHFVNNGLSFSMSYLGYSIDDSSRSLIGNDALYFALYVVAILICCFAYIVLNNKVFGKDAGDVVVVLAQSGEDDG